MVKMLSVGLYTYSSKPRGSVVHAACLAEALERQGAHVTLYALSKPGDEFYRPVKCQLRLIPAGPAPDGVDALIRQRIAEFREGIRRCGAPHRIHHAEDCLAANALAESKAELKPSYVVRTVHHVEHFDSPYLAACQERSVAAADLVLSVSDLTRREVASAFGREAPVIWNGVDLERFAVKAPAVERALRERVGLRPSETLILSVGGVEARKNSLRALEAIALAHAEYPSIRWVIAGGASIWEHAAYRERFARRVAELPRELGERVCVLGTVSEQELTALYQMSDVLLCPSLQEGFGLCVLEAMAARTAVVVPDAPPFDEYLARDCARFVDVESSASIARAVLALVREPESRHRSSQTGIERVRRYSWDRVAARHLARYESAAKQPDSPVAQRRF